MKKPSIKPHSFAAWMAFMRPKTFFIAAAPVLTGTAMAADFHGRFNFWVFALTIAAAILIQAMSNMVNDYAYNVRKAEKSNRVGLPRATTEGWVSMRAAKNMIAASVALCVVLSVALIAIGGWPAAVIAVLSVICAYCYMGGPKPIAYTPLGELLVFVFYGLFAVGGTYWLQTLSFEPLSLVPGAALGLLGAAVLLANNYRDIEHDISVGRRTLPAVCGKKVSQIIYALMIYLPFVFVGWMVPLRAHAWPLLFVLLALPRASFLPGLFARATPAQMTEIMLKTIRLEFVFSFLLTLGFCAAALLSRPGGLLLNNALSNPF